MGHMDGPEASVIRRVLILLRRVAYQAPVYCTTCPPGTSEPMYPMFAREDALLCCNECARVLGDVRARTTSKPKREWPVEIPAMRSIRRGKR